ncbi:MAG: DUF2177 family protein [Tissierellales bacterium]|nr:DUF2177 family protein [Tissierellales bacterium]
MDWIKIYGTSFCVFLGLDMLWLGLVARNFYKSQIGHLMSDTIVWPAAIIFYALFVGGLIYFAIHPALVHENWKKALRIGALFGFLTYATYDLTNLATLKDWPVLVTIVDLAWGTFLGGLTSLVSYFILNKFL